MSHSWTCGACNDSMCDGCEEFEVEAIDPELLSLADTQPAVEPMTLEDWEEREAVEAWMVLEDARAKAVAELAWMNRVRDMQRRAA